jgi:hypothetical protein
MEDARSVRRSCTTGGACSIRTEGNSVLDTEYYHMICWCTDAQCYLWQEIATSLNGSSSCPSCRLAKERSNAMTALTLLLQDRAANGLSKDLENEGGFTDESLTEEWR